MCSMVPLWIFAAKCFYFTMDPCGEVFLFMNTLQRVLLTGDVWKKTTRIFIIRYERSINNEQHIVDVFMLL